MKKYTLSMLLAISTMMFIAGCAGDNYNSGYNSYSYENSNDRAINKTIATEMNSLSDADIAQLNTLK